MTHMVLDPTGVVRPPKLDLTPAPSDLTGIGIGLIDNSKPNGAFVLEWIGRQLEERYGVSLHWIHKRTEARPAPEAELDTIAQTCRITLAAIAE